MKGFHLSINYLFNYLFSLLFFNIVLNSLQASDFSTPFNNDSTYLFNWTNIPQGRYSVSFSYKGANNGDFIANDSPQIFISFGNIKQVYW